MIRMVSTELSAVRCERPGLEGASEAPHNDALEPGLPAAQESDSSNEGTPDEPEKVRGLTWVPKRRCWILRYQDDRGKKRQKRLAAAECTRAGQAEALRWLEEYKEGCNEALDV